MIHLFVLKIMEDIPNFMICCCHGVKCIFGEVWWSVRIAKSDDQIGLLIQKQTDFALHSLAVLIIRIYKNLRTADCVKSSMFSGAFLTHPTTGFVIWLKCSKL